MKRGVASLIRWMGRGAALAVTTYASYVVIAWCRYGRPRSVDHAQRSDVYLYRLMPIYDIVERHRTQIAAPAELTFSVARSLHLRRSRLINVIFKARELVLGGDSEEDGNEMGLADQAKAWGWGVLAEEPGHEIVFGAVTQPWVANPVFRALTPTEFLSFHEPGYVKIAWTLRADSLDATNSVAVTETRVAITDPTSRAKFRQYWSFVSPGVILIRRLALRLVRVEAERLAIPTILKVES
jgi:hypothetical protein